MAAVIAPDAEKAAVLTDGPDMVHMSVPIEKAEDTAEINPVDGTPDIVVAGKCTDGTLDSDLQVVDPEASARWIKTWFDTGANIRGAHDPKWPAGRGLSLDPADPHRIKVLVADPRAKHLVRQRVLKDFSIGIMHPDVRVGDPRFKHLDPMGKATGGIITDRPDGLTGLGEISLVDRGANYGASFSLVKAAADGTPEWVGKMTGPEDLLTKDAGTVTLELPGDMSLSITPADLAKLDTLRRRLTMEQAVTKGAASPPAPAPPPAPALEPTTALKALMAAEHTVYKRDIDTATRRRLAARGRALPNLSYPIETHEDADNAVTLALSGHGDVGAAKRLIRRIAREEGWRDILARLSGKSNGKATKPVTLCVACGDTGITAAGACDACTKGAKVAARQARQAQKAGQAQARQAQRDALAERRRAVTTAVGQVFAEAQAGTVKKDKALCPGCGAKQNAAHRFCAECGKPLARALPVEKNHDFTCLGCGKTLDKGERFCPQCGKKNPGYLPEADRKIPANEDKSGKARVAKGKNGKKGRGRTPGAGVVGQGARDQRPAGPGREPDGAEVEAFERDAGMQDGDDEKPNHLEAHTLAEAPKAAAKKKAGGKKPKKGKKPPPWMKDRDGDDGDAAGKAAGADPELAAAMRLKSLNVPLPLGQLHDLTCPAYATADVAKAHPSASLAAVDLSDFQEQAIGSAATADFADLSGGMGLWQAALALKRADPSMVEEARELAHKSFRDANPGPASFPTPAQISAQEFRRPYITGGHAAPSPGHDAPHHAQLPPAGGIHAQDYLRPYLSEGHAADSPANEHQAGAMPVPERTGEVTGGPARTFYTTSARASAEHAMRVLHDHISQTFPGLCPMAATDVAHKPVPTPAGVPPVHRAPGAGKARKAAKTAARKAARKAQARRRWLEDQVLKGTLTVAQLRARLGLPPPGTPQPQPPRSVLEPEVIKAAMDEAAAPLLRKLARQDKTLARQQKTLVRQDKAMRKQRKVLTASLAEAPAPPEAPDPELAAVTVKAAMAEASAPLRKRLARQQKALARQDKTLRKQRKMMGALTELGVATAAPPPPPAPEPAYDADTPVAIKAALADAAIKAAMAEANAPLLRKLARQDKEMRKVRRTAKAIWKTADAIASQPDTTGAPFRGVALRKPPGTPAGSLDVAKSAAQAQANLLATLHDQWRNDPDPFRRQAAFDEICRRNLDPSLTSPPT